MPLARELRRGRILRQKEQAQRNAEALAEEQDRQDALPGGKKMERTVAPENKMRAEVAGEDKVAPVYPDAWVPFASDRAEALAVEFELTRQDFAVQTQSGRSGFNAADVRRIAEERGQ